MIYPMYISLQASGRLAQNGIKEASRASNRPARSLKRNHEKEGFDSGQNEKEGWVFAPDRGPENEDRSGRRVERDAQSASLPGAQEGHHHGPVPAGGSAE